MAPSCRSSPTNECLKLGAAASPVGVVDYVKDMTVSGLQSWAGYYGEDDPKLLTERVQRAAFGNLNAIST